MKSRIPKIWLSLAMAVPAGYGAVQAVSTDRFGRVTTAVLFYANVPARVYGLVANLKTLPERIDPTRSECNPF